MRPFDYFKPETFEEAFRLLSLPDKKVMPLAGATDLIPMVRDEHWQPDVVVDVKGLPGLCDIVETPEGLLVGAAVRMADLVHHPLVNSPRWNLLAQAAAAMGNEQVRNRATLGGNLCTASPAADSAPALLALEAIAIIRGTAGERRVPIAEFFLGPRKTALQKGELLVGVCIPVPSEGTVGTYVKLSRRKAGDLAIVGVAALAYPHNGGYAWRLALGAVAPTPIRAPEAEVTLNAGHDEAAIEHATKCAFDACCPIDDIRASAEYRKAMVSRIARRAIEGVLDKLP
ncbi:MAG: xanthine dehydrogenase family protein subunit M [Anaerolineae bacterium]|nr:xanthine dehydrogenase family protein subunit M [Anaerolineae bacterium]